MCHADQQWTEALPLVLLGIRTSFKADLQASVAELVYGEPLRIPGELLTPTVDPVEPAHLITHCAVIWPASDQFRHHTTPHQPHSCTRTSKTARMSFSLRTQHAGLWSPLTAAPTRSSRGEKTLQLLVRGKPVTVSADTVKPAYVSNEADCGSTIFNPLASATPDIAPPPATHTTCSGRRVRFPARFNT
jgi:hypothetical protein